MLRQSEGPSTGKTSSDTALALTTGSSNSKQDAGQIVQQAAALLAEARAQQLELRRAGQSERFRDGLAQAIALAESGLAQVYELSAELGPDVAGRRTQELISEARWILVQAQACRAEDARYGAGQLARGAQRAPTAEDCDDGWQRVAEIVAVCQVAAAEAAHHAAGLNQARARRLAHQASRAAHLASTLVAERNCAYTFHSDPQFSFGEGWYVTAAATLWPIQIQIEPDQPQTVATTHFLQQADLMARVVPYRTRPRANKALPELIARGFQAEPRVAQARVRRAFLGDGPIPGDVFDFAARALKSKPGKKVLLWVRYGTHHPLRNTVHDELLGLCHTALARGLVPVLIGDGLRGGGIPDQVANLTLFWKEPLFQGLTLRRSQLQLFEVLRAQYGVVGQMGVTTAGMDGPALMGLPTAYFTEQPNVRLGKWVGAVPGYQEIVRDDAFNERVAAVLDHWRA